MKKRHRFVSRAARFDNLNQSESGKRKITEEMGGYRVIPFQRAAIFSVEMFENRLILGSLGTKRLTDPKKQNRVPWRF